MAKRYGVLPSQVMKLGSTVDIKCAMLGVGYENYLNKKATDKSKGVVSSDYSQAELQAMLDAVRKK